MVKNGRVALIVLGLCFLLVSCGSADLDMLEVHNEAGDTIETGVATETDDVIIEYENSENNDLSFDEPPFEGLTISLANIDPALTRGQVDQPYWQRTSLCTHQLNVIEGVYLSDVDVSQRSLLTFRINNGSCRMLYHPFFRHPPNVILEKNIAGYWYEVPHLKEEPPTSRRQRHIATLQINANESSIFLAVDLNYWRPSEVGLYRLIVKISFNSDFTQQYFLSATFEIQETGIKYSEEQINKGIFLILTEHDYTEDVLIGIVKNMSDSEVSVPGWLWRMEKYVTGYWNDVPVNSMAPGGTQWSRGVFADADRNALPILHPGQELDVSVRLRYWHPLSVGTYRLTLVLFDNDGQLTLVDARGILPVSAKFEIVN